jgi:8-oxo-dGTP diphosphatase
VVSITPISALIRWLIERAGRPARRRIVVGVALLDGGGQVLVARRRGGGWELPGGKVEPGESERAAAVRECLEELAVRVAVTGRLRGSQPCGDGYRLRVWTGRVVAGQPRPLVHAELRWVGAGELAGLAWLPADVPFQTEIARKL